MNTDTVYTMHSRSPKDTWQLGEKLASSLHGGEVIELSGDLGCGKTLFVQGLAHGLGYTGMVTSPTYTISQIYELGDGLALHHFDFYRLGTGDIVADELAEVAGDKAIIVAVEWANSAGTALPADRLKLEFKPQSNTDRLITIQSIGIKHRKIIEDLKP